MQKSVICNNMEAGKGVTYDLHVQGDNISHILQKLSTERDHSKHVTKRLMSDEAIYPPKKRVLFEHKKLNGNNSNQKHDFPSFNKKESLEGKFENVNVVNFSRPRSDSLHSSYSQSSEHSESVSSVSREPSPYTIHCLYDNHRTPERNPMTAFASLNSDISKPLFPQSSDSDSSVADSDGHNSVNQSPEISYTSNREVCQKNETSVRVDDILNHMHKSFPRTHTLTSAENVTHLMSPEGSSLSNKYMISDGSSSLLPSFQNENIPERSSHLANTLKNGSQTIFDKSRLPETFPYSHIPHSMSDNSNQYASLELKLHRSNDSQKTSLEPADNSYMGPMDSLLSKFNMGSVNSRQNLKLEKKKKTKVNSSLNEFDCNIISAEKTLYKCRECNKEFKQSGQLSAHMKSHDTNYKCRICNELFVTGDELLNHMKADHAGDNPYKCEHCSREFSQYNNLRRHLRVHRDKIYKCNQCDREFNEEFYLTMHMGTHTGKRVYSCGVCNACFSTSHDLKMHVKTHSPSELHTCEVCGKSFSKACVLRQHKKGHSGDRPHKCEKCPKTFIHRHHLTMHMRSHVESKPYTCDLCQKEFYQSSHLYKHMRSHEEGKENSNEGQIDEFRTNRHEFKKIKEYHTHKTKENVLKTNVEYAVNNQEKVEVTLLQKTSSDVKTRKRSKSQANTVQSPVRPQTNVHALPPITQSHSFQQVGGHYPPHFPHPGLSAIGPRENHSSHGNYYPTGYNPAMFGSPLHGSQDYQNLYRAAYTAQMQAYYNSMYMMNYLSQNAMLQQAKGHLDVGYGVHGLPKVSHSKGHTEVNQFSNYRDINHAKSETDTKLPNNYHSFSQTKEQEEGDEHCTMTNAFIENDTCDKTIEMVTKQHRDKGEVQSNQDTDIAKFDGIGEDKARAEVAQQLVQMSTGVLSKSPNCVEKDTASSIEIPSAVTITTPTESVSVSVTPVSVSVTPDIDVPNNRNQPKRIDFSKCINAIIDRSFIEASSSAESNIQRLTTESKDKIRSESNKKNPDSGTTTNARVTSPPYQTINQTLNNVSRSVTHSLDNVPTPVTTRSEKYCSRLMMPYSNDSVPVNYSKIDRRDKPQPFNHYSVALNLSKTNSEDSEPIQSRSLAEIGLNQSKYLERQALSLKPSHMETSPAYLQTQSLSLKSSNMKNSQSSSYHCESRTPFSPMSEIKQPRKTGQEARIKTNTNFAENRPKIGEEENTSDVYKMKDLMKFSNVSANNSNHYHQRVENEHNKSIGQENQNGLQPKHNMSNILLESRTVTPSFNTGVVTLSHLPKKIFLQQHYETQNARNDIVGTHLDKKTIVRDSNDTEKEEIIDVSDKKLESNSFRNADCANSFDEYSVNDNDSDDIKNLRLKIEEVKNRIRLESGRSQDENLENSHKYKDIKLFKTTSTGNGVEIKINENSVGIEKAGETKDGNELEKSVEDSCDDSLDEKRLEIDLDVDSQKIEVTVYNKDVGDEKRDEKHVEIGNDENDVEMENVGLDEEIGKIDSIFSARISVENNTGSDSKTSDLEMDEYILKREGERINCYNNLQAKSGNEEKLVADKNASGIVEVKNFENASLRKVDSFKSTELIKKDSELVEGSEYPLDLRQSYKTKGKRRSKNGQNGNVKSRNKREMNLKNENWKENLVKLNSQNDENSKIENLNSSVNLTCVICWEMFDSLPDLEGHQLEHIKKSGTLNQCQFCDKAFARPFDLQCHILDHRKNLGENTENDKLLKSVSNEPTKLNGKDYDFNRVLTPKSHSKTFSDAGNGALKDRYKCDYCAETFDQSKSLKDHVLLHTVQKPYKCTVCLRGFAHKHNLNRHMMSHNAKSYECKVCDRTFKESFYLQMHMKIHSEDKYKRCEICGLQVPRSEIWKHTSDHIGNIVENPTYEQIGHRVEEILNEQNSEKGMSNLNIDVMSKQIGKFHESKGSYDQLANLMQLTKCIVGKEGQGETEKSAHSCKTDEHLNIHLNRNSSLSVYTQNI